MSVAHKDLVAKTLAANDRGDSLMLYPFTSESRKICGIFQYETEDLTGVEVRVPVFRIATCDLDYVSHGSNVLVSSEIEGMEKAPFEVKGVEYTQGGTARLMLAANV